MSKVQGGMKCVKYLLFVFNFIFWVSPLHWRFAWKQTLMLFLKHPRVLSSLVTFIFILADICLIHLIEMLIKLCIACGKPVSAALHCNVYMFGLQAVWWDCQIWFLIKPGFVIHWRTEEFILQIIFMIHLLGANSSLTLSCVHKFSDRSCFMSSVISFSLKSIIKS